MKLVLTSLVLKSFHNHNNFKENTPTSRDEKYHFKEKKILYCHYQLLILENIIIINLE